MQEATEAYMVEVFGRSNVIAVHCKRVGIKVGNMQLEWSLDSRERQQAWQQTTLRRPPALLRCMQARKNSSVIKCALRMQLKYRGRRRYQLPLARPLYPAFSPDGPTIRRVAEERNRRTQTRTRRSCVQGGNLPARLQCRPRRRQRARWHRGSKLFY